MDKIGFESLVKASLKDLPGEFRRRLENVVVVVEDSPSGEMLVQLGMKFPGELLGLYQGVPLGERGTGYSNVMPDKILIFKKSIEALCRTEEEISRKVREVVRHEIGHYFGMSEEDLRGMDEI